MALWQYNDAVKGDVEALRARLRKIASNTTLQRATRYQRMRKLVKYEAVMIADRHTPRGDEHMQEFITLSSDIRKDLMPLIVKMLGGSTNATPVHKYKDGCYYPADCPRCGKTDAAFIRGVNVFVCSGCNNDKGVTAREGL